MNNVIYIVDLDGTLVDNTHREHLIPKDKSNTLEWSAFNNACKDDKPREPVRKIIECLLDAGCNVSFVTGRGEAARDNTLSSLYSMFPTSGPFHLIMRPMWDHRQAVLFKLDIINEFQREFPFSQILAFEDDPEIVEGFRNAGVSVMHIESTCSAVLQKVANK